MAEDLQKHQSIVLRLEGLSFSDCQLASDIYCSGHGRQHPYARSMSKLTDSFRKVRVINSWDFYGPGVPFISYTPADNGRGGRSAYVHVVRPGYSTDPKAHWLPVSAEL